MKDKIKTGMLEAITEKKGVSIEGDAMQSFERNFERWHQAILITRRCRRWHVERDDSYTMVEPLGVFTTLPTFGRRLYNEIFDTRMGYEKDKDFECSIDFLGASELTAYVDLNGYKYALHCSFISIDQKQEKEIEFEGFKIGH